MPASDLPHHSAAQAPAPRLVRIAQARRRVMDEGAPLPEGLIEPWIAQSWKRCLQQGLKPHADAAFNTVSATVMRDAAEANRLLVQAARPVLRQLGQVLAHTRYFVILTNAQGVVVDTDGPIDRSNRHVALLTRVGLDLSERAAGTTSVGSALRELHPVWLHRGEHFYDSASVYSCAGAPLFGPDGHCAGMLDLTGVDVVERPELSHLAAQATRRIENSLLLQRPYRLLLRLNWPGQLLGDDGDGLITLDADGRVCGANQAARQLLPVLDSPGMELHARDLFALPWETLFDAGRQGLDLKAPLWSGIYLDMRPETATGAISRPALLPSTRSLREMETGLIRKAIEEARGNVALAARTLGISRTTIYRKLGK